MHSVCNSETGNLLPEKERPNCIHNLPIYLETKDKSLDSKRTGRVKIQSGSGSAPCKRKYDWKFLQNRNQLHPQSPDRFGNKRQVVWFQAKRESEDTIRFQFSSMQKKKHDWKFMQNKNPIASTISRSIWKQKPSRLIPSEQEEWRYNQVSVLLHAKGNMIENSCKTETQLYHNFPIDLETKDKSFDSKRTGRVQIQSGFSFAPCKRNEITRFCKTETLSDLNSSIDLDANDKSSDSKQNGECEDKFRVSVRFHPAINRNKAGRKPNLIHNYSVRAGKNFSNIHVTNETKSENKSFQGKINKLNIFGHLHSNLCVRWLNT